MHQKVVSILTRDTRNIIVNRSLVELLTFTQYHFDEASSK